MEKLIYTGEPIRIDYRLTTQFHYSRSFFHGLIKSGYIYIKSPHRKAIHIPKKSYTLLDGDTIYIQKFLGYSNGMPLPHSSVRDIDICYETDDYLVIFKPKNVLSHPTNNRNILLPSVVGALYHIYPHTRIKLVHRLDMDTDGYMILTKTKAAYTYFKDLFAQKSKKNSIEEKEAVPLHKYYRARCELTREGALFLQECEKLLPYYIQKIVTPNVPYTEPKMGISKILSVAYIDIDGQQAVEIELEILTGRTHQVRCHLSDVGLPIIGDTRYNATYTGGFIQLTAYRLKFMDMYREMKVFG